LRRDRDGEMEGGREMERHREMEPEKESDRERETERWRVRGLSRRQFCNQYEERD
jgi:DNA-binding CsgD family transcriptional regulator